MITLLRGDGRALRDESARLAASHKSHLLLIPASPRAWNGLRRLLEGLRELHGRDVAEGLTGRQLAALSLATGEPTDAQDEVAHAGLQLLSARPTSHLSHNFLVQAPLFQALATVVHELTAEKDLTLVVPDLAHLDRESLGLLRTLYRRFPETSPSLIAGFNPRHPTPEPDTNGLLWEQPADDVWKVALGWMAMSTTRVRDLGRLDTVDQTRETSNTLGLTTDDPALDSRAFAALDVCHTLGPTSAELIVEAMRKAFASFAFTTVVRLGLGLLEHRPELTPAQSADAHALLALAAHNRQFRSAGNHQLAEFLRHHLEQAFETETRLGHRSAIAYRLAVTHGRRLKQREPALEWAERAIDESRTAGIDPIEAANLEAWGRNIRAFLLIGCDRLGDAVREGETAFQRLGEALEPHPQALASNDARVREAVFSRGLLADNLAALAQMAGDPERVETWKGLAEELSEFTPELVRYEARPWITLYRRKLRLDAAADKARQGLEAARAGQDALREYRYTVELADLDYRLGYAKAALEGLQRAEALRHRLGEPEFLHPVRTMAAAAAARAGQVETARDLTCRALDALAPSALDARVQLLAFLGCLAAQTHDADEAEARINEAINLAVESGARDTLLAVAIAAGRASQHLGRPGDAEEAYRRAL
ncbi:MAG: hypothetical protein AAF657_39515, partial [Acidobacteriota bacterium]